MYTVHAKVDTIEKDRREVPEFLVNADSESDALALAREIIDPLKKTSTRITVTEEPRGPWRVALREDLREAIEALSGDSNVAEHDTLINIAQSLANYTGQDFDELMYGENRGHDYGEDE
jgi:hypothetical protein